MINLCRRCIYTEGAINCHAEVPNAGVLDADDVMMGDGGDLPPMLESSEGLEDALDPLQEQSHPEPGPDGLVEESMRTAFDVWHRLVEDALWV